jgi:hypothetical protein
MARLWSETGSRSLAWRISWRMYSASLMLFAVASSVSVSFWRRSSLSLNDIGAMVSPSLSHSFRQARGAVRAIFAPVGAGSFA